MVPPCSDKVSRAPSYSLLLLSSKVKDFRSGAGAKASLNRATQSVVVDAKPCDLSLVRVKLW